MKYSNLLQNYDIEYLEGKFITRNKKNNLFCHFFLNYCNFLKFI